MKEGRIKEVIRRIASKGEQKGYTRSGEDIQEEKEIRERKMVEKQAIHINLITQVEMKAHTKEMRNEMDQKFVKCLMAQGLTRLEAVKRVREWNAQWGSDKHGY